MKKIKGLILFLMSVGISFGQESWKKEGIKIPPTVCYASGESYHSYIHPPAEYFERLKAGTLNTAKIEVTYIGFPPEAKQAFQYAVDIWQSLISSPITIRVQANWQSLAKGVLGSCGPADYFNNFNSTQIWNCYYPVALVEKMLGEEINPITDYDITGAFNKDFSNWYFGTDGKTPPDQYDFVSVVLHELGHGLGFTGFFYSDRGKGGYSSLSDNYAAVFDQFVENINGDRLVNTTLFPNPSIKLNQNMTSGWLDFNTKLTEGKLPRLYAPAIWDSGSSFYHLDDVTYPSGDLNSLMTPFTGMGEAIHDPGPQTLAILYQIGWKTVTIKHKQLKDIEFVPDSISFSAQIEGDYFLNASKLYLIYSTNMFAKTDSVLLKATSTPTMYAVKLLPKQNGEIRYFFTATDVKTRRFVFPSGAPTRYLSFKIGVDKEPPVIVYDPVKYLLATNPTSKISAQITDNMGVQSAKLEYFVNDGMVKELTLVNDSDDLYTGNLVFPVGSVKDGDVVSYRVTAIDVSSQSNIGRLPLSGYNTFKIEGFKMPVDKYVSNFNATSSDFIGGDFNISTISGFDNPTLNSAHPYPSPDKDNTNFNFITILRQPIILKPGGKMSFDEIVLVEPGDPETKFGDENFFDYVIADGSKDGRIGWKPLIDGYDSNAQASWLNKYNSSMSGQNSTAVPTKDLFVKHEIDLLNNGNFKAGDTILVRFRLFSDPYAHGWGWTIDNLNIQNFGTTASPLLVSSGEVVFYPNPANDKVNIHIQSQNIIHKMLLKAYNSSGEMVFNQSFRVESNLFQTQIDVRNYRSGLYLFVLEPESGPAVTRKILIQ